MGTRQAPLCFKVVYLYTLAFEFLVHGASFFADGFVEKPCFRLAKSSLFNAATRNIDRHIVRRTYWLLH
jgi:hypothetical protein